MTILWSTLIIGAIGLIFGVILALASQYLQAEEDKRIGEVEALLPGYNCGACGTPSCHAFATEIVNGEAGSLSRCKPGKRDENFNPIMEYLKNNPNEDGSAVVIKI